MQNCNLTPKGSCVPATWDKIVSYVGSLLSFYLFIYLFVFCFCLELYFTGVFSFSQEETQNSRDRTHLCVSTSTSAYEYQLLCLRILRFGSLFPPILSPEFRIKRKLWMKTRQSTLKSLVLYSTRRWVLDVIVSIVVESILQMKELQSLNQSQRIALAGVLALLFPIFSPNLFRPLGRASPSLFSVSLISLSLSWFN